MASKVKSVLAWGTMFWDGSVWSYTKRTREEMRKEAAYTFADGFDIIRVRIVPAKGAKRGKAK